MYYGRNIPACAGKTYHYFSLSTWAGEHPRVRGENQVVFQVYDAR